MVTSNIFFTKIKHDSANNYLEDLWSEIVVTFVLRERQRQLTAKASIPEYIGIYQRAGKRTGQ